MIFFFDRTVSSNSFPVNRCLETYAGRWVAFRGFMAGHVRKDEQLAAAVHRWLEGADLPHLFRDQRAVKSQVSKMQSRHSDGVARESFAGSDPRNGRSWSASSSSGDGEDHTLAY